MGILTEEMKGMIEKQHLCHIATCSKEGTPNVAPRGSIRVVDDNTLVVASSVAGKTIANLKENPKVAIAVTSSETRKGFQFKGTPTIEESGSLFDKMVEIWASRGRPSPLNVIKIEVTEVYVNPPGTKI